MSTQFSVLVGENRSKIPPLLPVGEFFLARAPEVVKLYNALGKDMPERIPNHRRRRLKSYKPYWSNPKLPKNKSKGVASRRTTRAHRMYLEEPEKRRLALTHVWHAKRFHMDEIWGMRLPANVCDKGMRAIARLAKKECLVHDRSYMDCWEFGADMEKVRDSGRFTGAISHDKVVSGEFAGTGDIIDLDCNIVSSYQVFTTANNMNIWTHPSVRSDVEPIMTSIGGVLNSGRIRFELLGARALERLKSLTDLDTIFPISMVPGKISKLSCRGIELTVMVRGRGELVDLIFQENNCNENKTKFWSIWLELVARGSSAIGVYDRHAYITGKYCCPDFPFDFPASKAGTRQAALTAKVLVSQDQKRPKQCKVNSTTVESPFFPDWSLVGIANPIHSKFVHVTVDVVGKGAIEWNAHIYKDGILIGFVTSVGGDQQRQAVASIKISAEASIIEVKVGNPKSNHLFSATIQVCKVSSSESLLIGHSCIRT